MDDYQEQEYEFLRRLDEEQLDQAKLLKRGLPRGGAHDLLALGSCARRTPARAGRPADSGAGMSVEERSRRPRRRIA